MTAICPAMALLLLFATFLGPVPEKSATELTLDMHERFAYATMMRTALIHGYLERVRRHAVQLNELLAGTESEEFASMAREASEATDIAAAEATLPQSWQSRAQVYGRFLASCSDCHRNYEG